MFDYTSVKMMLREAHVNLHKALMVGLAIHADISQYSPKDLCQWSLPPGYRIVDDDTIVDENGNPVQGYPTPRMWKRLQEEAMAYYASAAFLTNDSERLDDTGVMGVDHWSFISPNLPLGAWKKI